MLRLLELSLRHNPSKDKWRNLSVANGQGLRDKSKTPKAKANPDTPATSVPIAQTSASVTPSSQDLPMVDSATAKPLSEGNSAAKYNAIIYEALSTLKEPNGLDSSTIANFIEVGGVVSLVMAARLIWWEGTMMQGTM